MSQLVKTKRQANFKGFNRFGTFKGLVEQSNYQKHFSNATGRIRDQSLMYLVAGQSATIRVGRGRRPRGPTFARGTIRSLFVNQEQARQRTALDVATRPPCRNLFRDAHFEIIQFVCAVNQFIFSLSGQGSFFVYRFTFSFGFSFTFGFRLFLSRFHFEFHFLESWCQPYRRSSSFVPSFAGGPFCGDTSGSRCDAAPGVASVVVSRRVPSTSGSSADIIFGANAGRTIYRVLRADSPTHYRFNI
jgi:hypothetical protein